jgi:uncharacterized protein YndB with AHSA1/START domain
MISINKDIADKTMYIVRQFKVPQPRVWSAWTESDKLDKWWGPKPWHAETKTMDFKQGGYWLYAMVGPQGEKHWSKCTYGTINAPTSFKWTCKFCDENGNPSDNFPATYWLVEMSESNGITAVNVTITFDNIADMEQLVKMQFEAGFTMGLNQLEEFLG